MNDGDREVLLNPLGWLTDNLINVDQLLLKKAFPHVSSLQDVTRGLVLSFDRGGRTSSRALRYLMM